MQCFEIAGYQTGLNTSTVDFLQPSDAFKELKNGYIYRQVLQSRQGFAQFATGAAAATTRVDSRGQVQPCFEVSNENVGNTAAAAAQSFSITDVPAKRDRLVISVPAQGKTITISYTTSDGDETFSGDVNTSGTNTIDWDTGAITVTFDTSLSAGDPILVTYCTTYSEQKTANTGAAPQAQTFTLAATPIVRKSIVVNAPTDGLTVTATWNAVSQTTDFTGDVDLGQPNSVNWETGAVTVYFDQTLSTGNLNITYSYYPSLRVMGIFEHIRPDNTTELLVIDTKYLYRFSGGEFTQVPFTSADAITDFNIQNNWDYVSGTTYPKKDFGERFVFTGRGMEDVYFYDGYGVKRFTNATDNPDYQAFATGDINKAYHVIYFGERLNFVAPTINNQFYPQGVLYSAIRNSAGNGDKFNTAGAGRLDADTGEFVSGATILGNVIALSFTRSFWILEKTRDAFNPYFIRRIPSQLGSDAPFGLTKYNEWAEAMGITGLVGTDAREAIRTDDKVPFFTRDNLDPGDMRLVYAGFLREARQFWFSYREYGSDLADENVQDKVLVHNYEEDTWAVYDMRLSCFGESKVGLDLTWNQISEAIKPEWARWDTTDEAFNEIGIEGSVQKTLAGDDEGFIYVLDKDFDDMVVGIVDITQTDPCVISLYGHAFKVGDEVVIQNVEGMTQINYDNYFNSERGRSIPITAVTANTITVDVDASLFSAYTGGGIVSKVIDFEALTIPLNPFRQDGLSCFISHVDVLITNNNGYCFIDLFENDSDVPYKEDVLMVPNAGLNKNRQWVRFTVNHEADFHKVRIRQKSVATQYLQTSMRLFLAPGGPTDA